jgi:hypothetical protein
MKNDPVSRSQPFDPVYARLFALYEGNPAEARRVVQALANHEAMHLVYGKGTQADTQARIDQIYATLAEVALNAAYAAAIRDAVAADAAVRDAAAVRDVAAQAASYAAAYSAAYARANAYAAAVAADAAYAVAASVRDAAHVAAAAAYDAAASN